MALTTKEYITLVIEADAPCSLKHLIADCDRQGFTKGFTKAFHELRIEHCINTYQSEGATIIELV